MAVHDVDLPVTLTERAVYLPEADALVCADLHVGRGAASNVDAPIDEASDVVGRLTGLLDRFDPATVVVAGDLLHSFSRVPRGVERSVDALRAAVYETGAALVVTPGNHDAMLDGVFDGRRQAEYRLDDDETVVLHGHEAPETPAGRYVIGHDHPALSVEGRKLPCYLYGPGVYRVASGDESALDGDEPVSADHPDAADVLVLPAFTTIARGTTVNGMRGGDFQSPLVTDAGAFHPAVRDERDDETLWFPPLRECRRLL